MQILSSKSLRYLSLLFALVGGVATTQYAFLEHSLSRDIESVGNRMERVENRMESVENRMERVEDKIDSLIVHLLEKESSGNI